MLNISERKLLTLIFLILIVVLGLDIVDDLNEGASLSHVVKEVLVMVLGTLGVLVLWNKYLKAKSKVRDIQVNIEKLKEDLSHYKEETQHLSQGIGQKINDQLERWSLTKSEKDIALLLLKGLSVREISEIRSSSEKTIKQHCSNLYQKANIKGRSELSAFFLEDILVLDL
ncbi:LuxR C-terminal-related transcriptional regulator [Halobacteriovorax sp. HLS]|uniref:helix-turn-helix transcriptional regulator n=1 Tax=Halobacteriovorax sp. HLS TaxID=2234000 RepID=UPI000FDC621A|nr:LuxR C-terminal-related transcriptional regulator [Halobacteriovorax sp. HLS]